MTENTQSTKKCPKCLQSIDIKAKKCQHCSTDLRNWFVRHPLVTIALLIFFIPIIITAFTGGGSYTPPKRQLASEGIDFNAGQNKELLKDLVVVSSKIVKNEIGTPEWHVVIKNTGKKTVDAYKIYGFLYDNFGNPVGKFNNDEVEAFVGMSQDKLAPGSQTEDVYNLAVYDHTTKVENAQIKQIHFTDGTTAETEY
jgi:hypothetical protein